MHISWACMSECVHGGTLRPSCCLCGCMAYLLMAWVMRGYRGQLWVRSPSLTYKTGGSHKAILCSVLGQPKALFHGLPPPLLFDSSMADWGHYSIHQPCQLAGLKKKLPFWFFNLFCLFSVLLILIFIFLDFFLCK